MFDTHYYFEAFDPTLYPAWQEAQVQFAGLNFRPQEGYILLPGGEGSVVVTNSDGKSPQVKMATNGSGITYSHALVNVI